MQKPNCSSVPGFVFFWFNLMNNKNVKRFVNEKYAKSFESLYCPIWSLLRPFHGMSEGAGPEPSSRARDGVAALPHKQVIDALRWPMVSLERKTLDFGLKIVSWIPSGMPLHLPGEWLNLKMCSETNWGQNLDGVNYQTLTHSRRFHSARQSSNQSFFRSIAEKWRTVPHLSEFCNEKHHIRKDTQLQLHEGPAKNTRKCWCSISSNKMQLLEGHFQVCNSYASWNHITQNYLALWEYCKDNLFSPHLLLRKEGSRD